MTNGTTICPALLTTCNAALRPTAQTGWKPNLEACTTVRLPDETTARVRCVDVLAAARGAGLVGPQHLYAWQGARGDLWHVGQLRQATVAA